MAPPSSAGRGTDCPRRGTPIRFHLRKGLMPEGSRPAWGSTRESPTGSAGRAQKPDFALSGPSGPRHFGRNLIDDCWPRALLVLVI